MRTLAQKPNQPQQTQTPNRKGKSSAVSAARQGLDIPQRQHTSGDGETFAPPIVNEVLQSSGQPLEPATREFMEPRFGHNFSRVRIHTDEKAMSSARTVGALAYTFGQHP